jgi:hypothetical protein
MWEGGDLPDFARTFIPILDWIGYLGLHPQERKDQMKTSGYLRLLMAVLFCLAIGLSQVSLALAQAPVNDDFDAAIVIPSLPFTDTQDTTEATEAPDDPPLPSCVGVGGTSHSVWYQFTPSEDMAIAADTIGSDYDTTLSVYTGDRSSLSEVACNDDAFSSQSRVVFDATAGVTYFFMVGSYSYFDPPAGTLVFNVDVGPPPFEFDLRVDERGLVRPSTGEVTITGEVECSRQAYGSISIDVEQRIGRFIVRGSGYTYFENCEGVTPWSITVIGDNGLFVGGKVEVSAYAGAGTVDEEFPSFASDDEFLTVRLEGGPPNK